MQRKTKLKKFFSASGVSLVALFFSAKNAFADWNAGISVVRGYGLPEATLYGIITNILDWLLTIVGVVGVIGFVIAGLMYLTANGDEKKVGDAKKAMMASIYGIIVALCGLVAIYAVNGMLNAGMFF